MPGTAAVPVCTDNVICTRLWGVPRLVFPFYLLLLLVLDLETLAVELGQVGRVGRDVLALEVLQDRVIVGQDRAGAGVGAQLSGCASELGKHVLGVVEAHFGEARSRGRICEPRLELGLTDPQRTGGADKQ